MGTDYLKLFDKRTAQIILQADEFDLVTLVDFWTRRENAAIWKEYWHPEENRFVDFAPATSNIERLQTIMGHGIRLHEIKKELLRVLCTMEGFFYLDYWGCWVEAFAFPDAPPGAILWEDFIAPIQARNPGPDDLMGSSGTYLLTPENIASILRSLEEHKHELTIMKQSDIDKLKGWQAFCKKDYGFCTIYQMDF
jgi:hypothetical protein